MKTKLFVAVKAFIVWKGKVLIVRESTRYKTSPNQGKYDVVGGKIKPGEKFDKGLRREIKEEVGLSVVLVKPFSINEWRVVVNGVENHIVGTFVECMGSSKKVKLAEVYDDYQWINPKDFRQYKLVDSVYSAFEDYNKLKK